MSCAFFMLSAAESFEQLVVYVVETTVRHDHDVIATLHFARKKRDDVISRHKSKCSFPTRPNPFRHAIRGEGFGRGKMRCTIDTRDDGRIGRVERLNKGLLENPSPAGVRTRFKNSPDARPGITLPHRAQRLVDRRRMMGEVIINNDAIHFAADLQPALSALEGRTPA